MDKLVPITLPPGMRNTGTRYQSKNRWYDGNLVRFFQGMIMPVGGWSAWTTSGATITGTPNAAISWVPDKTGVTQAPVLAIGTTAGLYVIVGTVVYDITPAGMASNSNRVWTLDTFGAYLVAASWIKGTYTSNTGPYVWQCDTATKATVMTGAMSYPNAVVTTPERFVFQLGGVAADPEFATVQSSRTVFWPSQETIDDWVPSADNSAGDFNLTTPGALVCGAKLRTSTMLWTTTDAWLATYVGGEAIYSFTRAGDNCGIVSPNAKAVLDTSAYWMGANAFFKYDGFTQPIDCDVYDKVFGSFNRSYAHLVWALANPMYGEVTWFYPSGAATSCDRYVTYNYREGHWVTGTMSRACGVTSIPPSVNPVLVGTTGILYTHETGTSFVDGVAPPYTISTASLESGPFELEEGDHTVAIQKVIPDDKTVGDVNLTLYTALFPDAYETTNGPYTLTQLTSVRLKARQVRLKLTQAVANAWRVGVIRLGVVPSSRR